MEVKHKWKSGDLVWIDGVTPGEINILFGDNMAHVLINWGHASIPVSLDRLTPLDDKNEPDPE